VVGRDQRGRRRGHHVALPAGVLGQVLLQLELERVLVRLELGPVVRREVDRVLVGNVDARDRDGAVVVHLLDELARELDGLHVRPEGAAEYALAEGFDLVLDSAPRRRTGVGAAAAGASAPASAATSGWPASVRRSACPAVSIPRVPATCSFLIRPAPASAAATSTEPATLTARRAGQRTSCPATG